MLYAVKRIKKKISSESEGRLVVKESCALASLMSCPFMIRYFGCWIDDGHLYIQTEYCDKGSMDCFVLESNVWNSDPLIPDNRDLNINRNNEDDDIQLNNDDINHVNGEKNNNINDNNDDNKSQNNGNDDNRNMKKSADEIFTEKSNTTFNEKHQFSVYENCQNDSLFDSQEDAMEDNDGKENREIRENTVKYNSKVINHYNNNNDDNDDELFIKEEDNQIMTINIDGIDISQVIKNNAFYSDIDKEKKMTSECKIDAQLRYTDAIFSVEEDSRNSDSYSCFSESNSNNYYDLKYNNKQEFQNENEVEIEVENSNYENQILKNNKNNNKDTVNQEKRFSNNIDGDALQIKYDDGKDEKRKVTEEEIGRDKENDIQQNNDDRRGMIEVEKERTREGEGRREKVGVGKGGQEEENRSADNEMPSGVVSEGLVWGILHSMGSALQYMHSRGDLMLCSVM